MLAAIIGRNLPKINYFKTIYTKTVTNLVRKTVDVVEITKATKRTNISIVKFRLVTFNISKISIIYCFDLKLLDY